MPLIYRLQHAGHLFGLKILNNCQATFQSLQLTEKLDDSMIWSASNLGEVDIWESVVSNHDRKRGTNWYGLPEVISTSSCSTIR